ncbi:hypothetical protein [Dactylosporangium sp. CS-033363]|uniref:hypothetical protein n=1 Tax=Dactylosporangium sp. CS-033363 TaxID=3239935 RepID=UPI003D8DC49E
MSEVRFGPSGEARLLTRFVLLCAPFILVVFGFGGYLAVGEPDRFWRVMSWSLIVVGTIFAVVGAAAVAMEASGRSAGPDGVKLFRRTLPWSDIARLSRHAGVKNRELVAAWPLKQKNPVWLGDVTHASVPRDEALRMLEAWSGRRVEH